MLCKGSFKDPYHSFTWPWKLHVSHSITWFEPGVPYQANDGPIKVTPKKSREGCPFGRTLSKLCRAWIDAGLFVINVFIQSRRCRRTSLQYIFTSSLLSIQQNLTVLQRNPTVSTMSKPLLALTGGNERRLGLWFASTVLAVVKATNTNWLTWWKISV